MMEPTVLLYILGGALVTGVLMMVSFIAGSHTATRSTRTFIQSYDDLLGQVTALQSSNAAVIRENAELKGQIFELRTLLEGAMGRIAQLSATLDRLREKYGDDPSFNS